MPSTQSSSASVGMSACHLEKSLETAEVSKVAKVANSEYKAERGFVTSASPSMRSTPMSPV